MFQYPYSLSCFTAAVSSFIMFYIFNNYSFREITGLMFYMSKNKTLQHVCKLVRQLDPVWNWNWEKNKIKNTQKMQN